MIKAQAANRSKYAHIFFVCNNTEGMKEALDFEGYVGSVVLVQEYRAHYEQVYKCYGIGPNWYRFDIKKSIPHKIVTGQNCFKFDSQIAFADEDFTKFSKTENRTNEKATSLFFKNFVPTFGIALFGVDIIVEEETGRHLIIDCNYFSSYTNIPENEITFGFDQLVRE